MPGATRVTVKERDREPLRGTLPGNGYRLSVDVFAEFGARARSATWQLEVKRAGDGVGDRRPGSDGAGREPLPAVAQSRETVRRPRADDLGRGSRPDAGRRVRVRGRDRRRASTGLVLLGRGEARFHPTPEVEKGQLKIFCGADVLQTRFDATYVRINPRDVAALVDAEPPDAAAGRCRASSAGPTRCFAKRCRSRTRVDMADMSRDLWSIMPAGRRLSRRDSHAALRHADLRPIARRAGRHLVLRSQAAPQHRRLFVQGGAGALRPVVQRRRFRQLRRPRLRHRSGRLAGSVVAGRPGAASDPGPGDRDQLDLAAAGRNA